jgi:hypothetical protein
MIDFESRLTTLLDDAAASIHPHPDPDAAFLSTVTPAPNDVHRFRPSFAAVAAAGIVLIGGSAFAMERLTSDSPQRVTPADAPETTNRVIGAVDEPTTTAVEPTTTTIAAVDTPPATRRATRSVMVSEPNVPPTEPTVPSTEPTAPPVVIEFTANLGANGRAKNPMTQGFFGTSQPGSAIRVASPYGVSETTANGDGNWETTLTMREVPAGTQVAVRITSNTTDTVREFSLLRPAPAPPATIEFTANLGLDGQANTPMTQGFYGTAPPESAIRIASEWGVAETLVGPNGNWDATLVMPEVPPGTAVAVRITSSATDRVREFTLHRPGESPPPFVAFTANAALTTSDRTPPVNEYWGTSTAGAVIALTSEYGGTQVESNADGNWSARIEFPDAPSGVTFNVHVTSSKGEAVYDFSFTRVGPG